MGICARVGHSKRLSTHLALRAGMLHSTSGRTDFYPAPAARPICTHAAGEDKPENHVQLLVYLPSGATFALHCPWDTPHSKILAAAQSLDDVTTCDATTSDASTSDIEI